MPSRNVNLTEHFDREGLRPREQREQEDKARIDWLRGAAKEGFGSGDRGNYVTHRSDREIDDFVDQVRREVSEKLAAEKVRA